MTDARATSTFVPGWLRDQAVLSADGTSLGVLIRRPGRNGVQLGALRAGLLIALCWLTREAHCENPGVLEEANVNLPAAQQQMWDLRHRYHDPKTGALCYEIRADYGTTRVEDSQTFFDVTKPEIEYYDRERVTLMSSEGVIDLKKGKEKMVFTGEVIGYLDTAKTAKFVTDELEIDFEGNGQSDRPIRFTQKGMVLLGQRSLFFRTELPATGEKQRGTKAAKVVVYGPGYATFQSKDTAPGAETSPTRGGDLFVVEYRGSASYSQLQPVLFFSSDVSDKSDRVTLCGDGFVLKCLELQVHAREDLKAWDKVYPRGDVRYKVCPGVKATDKLSQLQGKGPR